MLSSTRLSARRSALAGRALARPVAARLRRARPAHSRTVTQAIFERYSEMSIKAIMRAQTMAKDMGYSEVRAEQPREEGGGCRGLRRARLPSNRTKLPAPSPVQTTRANLSPHTQQPF